MQPEIGGGGRTGRGAGDGTPAAAVILAAGRSSRMGRSKLLLDFGGVPLVRHAVLRAVAAGFDPVIAVVARSMDASERALSGLPVTIRVNDRADAGLSTSIAAGLASVGAAAGWAALLLADQPLVPVAHLAALRRLANTPYEIVASRYQGTVGAPAIFVRGLFSRLMKLTADHGCKTVIHERADRTLCLDCPEAAMDVDTPDDYGRALEAISRPAAITRGVSRSH